MITFTTDLDDVYVAQMRGAVLRVNPSATIVDISHSVGSFNVRRASFALMCAVRIFPPNAVHVCVVDPGVGSTRKALVIGSEKGFFVGPDNGVFTLPLSLCRRHRAFEIDPFRLPERTGRAVSTTFHGRDIFAPVAAFVDMGEAPESFGSQLGSMQLLDVAEPTRGVHSTEGEIIFIDGFGNIITNIPDGYLGVERGTPLKVSVGGKTFPCVFASCYSDVEPGRLIVLVGSQGTYEISLNRASAQSKLGCAEGDRLRISED